MRSLIVAIVAATLVVSCLSAADPVPVPVPVPSVDVNEIPVPTPAKWCEHKTLPGRQLVLSASGAAKWVPIDEGFDLVPSADGKQATFSAATPGRYRMVVIVAGEPVRLAVTVAPVTPPPPPTPEDLLTSKLKAAFAAETAANKSDQARDLAALFRQASIVASDPQVTTTGQLLQRIQTAAKNLVGKDSLVGLRAITSGELGKLMPVDMPLTSSQRDNAAALFNKLATILGGLQ